MTMIIIFVGSSGFRIIKKGNVELIISKSLLIVLFYDFY